MTIDAGIQQIAAGFAPPGPGPGAGLELGADLAVQVGGLTAELRSEQAGRRVFQQKLAQAIRHVPLLTVSAAAGAPQTFVGEDWVCKTGFAWYVQLITAKNLGSTDTVWVHRTPASGAFQLGDSTAKWLLTNAAPAWHPGRTALRLGPGDGISVQGTTTQQVTVNIDVIAVELWIEADFLL